MKHVLCLLMMLAQGSLACAQAAKPAEIAQDRRLFQARCANCHSVACNRWGPKLEGIVGRKAATVPDFKGYSAALRDSGLVWDDRTLDAFLADGARLVPGNVMSGAIGPVTDPRERRSLLAHMRRQDRSIDVC